MINPVQAHILFIDRAYSVDENSRKVRTIVVVIRRNNNNKFLISIGDGIIAEFQMCQNDCSFFLFCACVGLRQ